MGFSPRPLPHERFDRERLTGSFTSPERNRFDYRAAPLPVWTARTINGLPLYLPERLPICPFFTRPND